MILTMYISIQDDGTPTGSHISEFITTGETWEEYLQRMSEDGQWATEVELAALSNALGAAVLVTNDCDHDEQFQHWIYPPELMTMMSSYLDTHIVHNTTIACKVSIHTL